jgi:hypothetical protein
MGILFQPRSSDMHGAMKDYPLSSMILVTVHENSLPAKKQRYARRYEGLSPFQYDPCHRSWEFSSSQEAAICTVL